MFDTGEARISSQQQLGVQSSLHTPTLRESLLSQLAHHQANIGRIKEILGLLDTNPDMERVLTLLREYGRI